ncbi:helix-turn-helix transcriptional regulator [Hazenella sp. IB182357]|uniref:Helix-turn-helix transcriptional regulator n=1 Tax=Polycladospora coralii TaxID=2771432 RepID=A0A926NBJ0_9BACL|nr:helix-turn-helix transcriptional regulator [Polycladospora coralii]MBD1373881.1 helix-turn-helix transcriptional regulator [Polycladospora coralii]
MSFADKLKKRRKALGITQQTLADELGVSHTTVSKWESGNFDPDTSTLKKIANYLHVSIDYLLENENESPETLDILEALNKNRLHIEDPKTGEPLPIPKLEERIIKNILIDIITRKEEDKS